MASDAQIAVKSFPAGKLLPAAPTGSLVPAKSWNLFFFLTNFSASVRALFRITAEKTFNCERMQRH